MMDFPRLQLAALLAVNLAGYGLLVHESRSLPAWGFAGALGLALVWQLGKIIPYTPLVSRQAKNARGAEAESITLIVANVLQHNRKVDGLLAQVRAEKPDLLLVVEIDGWWRDQLAVLDSEFPNSLVHPLDNTYGIGLYSRLELVAPKVRTLIEEEVPSLDTRVRLASGGTIQFYGLHPKPPAPGENKQSTERDAELVLVGTEAKQSSLPVIVAGDMNDVAWSATTRRFQRISGLLDPRIGRGLFSTFHAEIPIIRWPLDHVFFSSHFHVAQMRRLASFGSDHFPILMRLSYEPEVQGEHREPAAADSEDRQEAREVVEDAGPTMHVSLADVGLPST